jgi:hypothetical protein
LEQADLQAANFSGVSIAAVGRGSVHKNHGVAAGDIFRHLGSELVGAEDLDLGTGELALEFIGRTPREPIVASHRISVRDDEDAGHNWEFIS